MVEQMEKKIRRNRIDLAVALVLISIVIVAMAVAFGSPLLRAGAVVMLAGFGFLTCEVVRHSRRAPVAADGATTSIDYHRALLEHRIEFHRTRLWLRVLSLAPGGVLFFLGFAAARPDLAPFIYVQLATFVIAIALVVPMNRRAAAKLEDQIGELERLRGEQSSL